MTFDIPIYLDFNASTPPDPAAVDAMQSWLGSRHSNPHASHLSGQRAAAAIDAAISSIRKLINAQSGEIIFTSGATESNNLALAGIAAADPYGTRILCSNIEHKSVLEVIQQLKSTGVAGAVIPVDINGRISADDVESVICQDRSRILVISLMHANNEIGSVQPIHKIAKLKEKFDFIFHVDAAQTAGKMRIDVDEMGVDLLSISSHKMYGPAGIGALYVSNKAKYHLKPIMHGGGQQNGIRPGTLPVFLVSGFAAASEKALAQMSADSEKANALSDIFCERLKSLGISFKRISPAHGGLPGLLSLSFDGVEGDDLVLKVAPKLSLSTGSACNSRELQSSHVLRALGLSEQAARGVIRIGFGRPSAAEHACQAAEVIAAAVHDLSERL